MGLASSFNNVQDGEHSLFILDDTGHTTLTWKPEVEDSVKAVKVEFDAIIKRGWVAYGVTSKGQPTQIKKFDPQADRIVMSAPLVGG